MSLRKLIYVSDATVEFDEAAAVDLAKRAMQRNSGRQVTGVLAMRDGAFLQYLEGPPESLEAVWRLIRKDPRHDIRNHLDYQVEDGERVFPDWHMRYLSMADPEAETTMVLDQMFRRMEIPDADYARAAIEAFVAKIADDFS